MNIFQAIYRLFNNTNREVEPPPSDQYLGLTYVPAYTGRVLQPYEDGAIVLEDDYGADFNAFFHRRDIDTLLKKKIVPMILGAHFADGTFFSRNGWADKNPLNFPGPLYTDVTDTIGSGPPEASLNVFQDFNDMEFVGRQPHDYAELICTINAAGAEPFDGYACDGNLYWTIELCREWWRITPDKLKHLAKAAGDQRYLDYLDTTAEVDLRRYCYFLDNGHYPIPDQCTLPDL